MNKKVYFPLFIALCAALFLGACDRAPVQKLVNPTAYVNTDPWTSPIWVLYDEDVKTGGIIGKLATDEGQVLDVSWRENPHGGSNCIKFSWDGSETTYYETGLRQYTATGFSLIVADDTDEWATTTRDLTPGEFTKLTFYMRGSLNSNVTAKVSSAGRTETIAASDLSETVWTKFTLSLAGADFSAVKDYATIILSYDPVFTPGRGNGGTIYIDDIQLEK